MIKNFIPKNIRKYVTYLKLNKRSKEEFKQDHKGLNRQDLGIDLSVKYAVDWLLLAQKMSSSKDNGVAALYSLLNGWSSSYPETTGYIIPTLIKYSDMHDDNIILKKTKKMLDWLVSIQFEDGSFQGGFIDDKNTIPNTFNTGQILIGLSSGAQKFGEEYINPMVKAATWLVNTQNENGSWTKHPSHWVNGSGAKTYENHVILGLLEAARITGSKEYSSSAINNALWSISHQNNNGWFNKCSFDDNSQPLTHLIGYAFRGILEAYIFSKDENIFNANIKIADNIIPVIGKNGFLPGRLSKNWSGPKSWSCLTGNVQIAYCYLKLFQITENAAYLNAGRILNKYVRKTIKIEEAVEKTGAIKGSFPIWGGYLRYNYLNWANKFFIDSNLLEKEIVDGLQ